MKAEKKRGLKHPVYAPVLLGLLILGVVAFLSVQADMAATTRLLSTTATYIKEQCNRYARIELASETKSLMRLIESGRQIAHQLEERSGRISESALADYARNSYVSGVLLLDENGAVLARYHAEDTLPEAVLEALDSPALLDTCRYPEKRYALRLHSADGSEIDLAAIPRLDRPGILVTYYHTPLEYIDSFNLSVFSLLCGYSMENDGTIVVSSGERIVASNDSSLIGRSSGEVPILNKIKAASQGKKMVHTCREDGSLSQFFGLMEHGRDCYVYAFLPERSVFPSTPRTMFYALIAYLVVVMGASILHWRTAQRTQVAFSRQLQSKNDQLTAAIQEADRANAAKTSFLSRMSHDIRTPLNGIIGLLTIDAAHPEDTGLLAANREKMRVAANHLLSLINDILQMSKLESGEILLAREVLDLDRLSAEVQTIISQRAAESGISLVSDPGSDRAQERWVYGSPLHLRQIFLNIYTNCIKYNKVGGSITTCFRQLENQGGTVTYRWTITDTGIGMSEAFLRHIFDPFTQENTDARSVCQGTGLGMTIVKGLVERMGGSIEVRSTLGVGSAFLITIPFAVARAPRQEPPEESEAQGDIRGLRLMLVEDNDLNAEIARILLEDAGATVTWVDNGQKAVNLFQEKAPGTFDMILMDVMMPVMDGLTAAKTIRALPRPDAKTVPIIAMTANAFAEDAEKCLAAGMNAHLSKPLEIGKVLETLARYRAPASMIEPKC